MPGLEAPAERRLEIVRGQELVDAIERVLAKQNRGDQSLDALSGGGVAARVDRDALVDELADAQPLQRQRDDRQVVESAADELGGVLLHGSPSVCGGDPQADPPPACK